MYKILDAARILRKSDQAIIPICGDNMDYAAYLQWVDEGNDPEPQDPPSPHVVKTVSSAQGGIALIRAGLMEPVQAAANDPSTPAEVKWAFEKANEWNRDSDAFNYLAAKAGISESERDTLFAAAAEIIA